MRLCWFLLAGLALDTPLTAQRTDLPPAAVVMEALDSHPTVAAARARVAAARAQERMLRKGPHEFSVQGSVARRSVDREGDYLDLDASLSRAIRLPGKAALDRQAGALGIEVALNRMEDVRHEVALSFSNLWHDWLTAAALHRNDLKAVASLEEALRAVRRRAALQDAALLDVDQADAALSRVRAQAAASAAQEAVARANLTRMFPDIPLPQAAPELAEPGSGLDGMETLHDAVIARSHEIRAAEREAQRLEVLARRARADRIADPSFGLRLFRERSGTETGAGITASIPLGGGHRAAASDQAAALASAAGIDLAQTRREVEATAAADVANVRSYRVIWENMQRFAAAAAAAANRTSRGHSLGALDLADSLLAQREANEARRQEIQARGDLLRFTLKLEIDAHSVWMPEEDDSEAR